MYIFLKTHPLPAGATKTEKLQNRLRALPGQKFPNGSEVRDDINIKSTGQSARNENPVGTIFYTDSLHDLGGTYQCTSLYLLDTAPKEVRELLDKLLKSTGTATGTVFSEGSYLDGLARDDRYRVPTIEDDGFYIATDDWYYLMRNIGRRIPTLITGPTGVGKTEIVRLIGDRLGLPFHWYDMGTMIDASASLLGTHRLSAGASKWDYASFALQIQQPGIILLDELSRAPASTLNLLFPCLDNRRALPVELACEGDLRSIPVHPECTFVATANVTGLNGDFSGTNELDDALVNRFLPMELGYLDESIEADLLVKRTGVNAATAGTIVLVATRIRELHAKGDLSKPVSTRETLAVASLTADGCSVGKSLERLLLPLYEGTATEGERAIVKGTLITR